MNNETPSSWEPEDLASRREAERNSRAVGTVLILLLCLWTFFLGYEWATRPRASLGTCVDLSLC